MKHRLLLLLACLSWAIYGLGQTRVLSGLVRDEATGEALPYATVLARDQGTQTNVDGYFTLLGLPADSLMLEVYFPGFRRKKVAVGPQTSERLLIELVPYSTDEVLVTATRDELLQTSGGISVLRISPQKIAMLPNVGEKDLIRALQLMPGVSAANENSAGLYIRGGTPDQVLMLYDGFTVYNVEHLYGFYSAFNASAIKDIQLFKGGFESRYGGRTNAVADLTAKDGNSKKYNIRADVNLLSVNAMAEVPIGKKITALAAFRRSWQGPIYQQIFDKYSGESEEEIAIAKAPGDISTYTTTISSFFYDLNGKITYKPTDKDIISASFYNGTDNLDNSRIFVSSAALDSLGIDISGNVYDITRWGNTGGSLKYSRQINKRLYTYSLFGYSKYFSERDRTGEDSITNRQGETRVVKTGTIEENVLNDYSWRTDFTWKIRKNHDLVFGTDLHRLDVRYTYATSDTLTLIDRTFEGITAAAYAQDTWSLAKDRLRITPGIRYTWYDVTAKSYWEPRLNIAAQVSKTVKLKGAWGIYNQFANRIIREDILSGSRDFWILANGTDLPVSTAIHYIAGALWENKNFLIDVEGYHKQISGLAEYSLRFAPAQVGAIPQTQFFNGSGNVTGFDMLLQKKYGNYTGWISYGFCDARNQFDVYGEEAFAASGIARHEFKIVNNLTWKNFDFSAVWVYAAGKPYTAPLGVYEIPLFNGDNSSYLHVSDKNALSFPDYHRLDIAATWNFKLPGALPCSLGLSVFNLYNRKNIWYKEYSIVENQILETSITFLGITPNVSFSIKLR